MYSDSSIYSDYNSGSEYEPPIKIQSERINLESSDEISIASTIDLDHFVNNSLQADETPSSTSNIENNKINQSDSILNNELTESTKLLKKGYNFNGRVETSKFKQINNKRSWDKTSNCIYCEKNVTNFTRHIIRNHSTEIDVARYISLPKGSESRKVLADNIRKRGNFLCNVGEVELIKPVRRPNEYSKIVPDASNYLPCKHCYGLYKKKYLYRHEKNCKCIKTKHVGRNNAQADAQNILLAFSNTDQELIKKSISKNGCRSYINCCKI